MRNDSCQNTRNKTDDHASDPSAEFFIYTTNTLEGFNRQLRKVTKNKAVFPNDEALRKTLYLTTRDITEKWSMPYRDWGETYGQFIIEFGDRASIA